jgi:hypothetical protein
VSCCCSRLVVWWYEFGCPAQISGGKRTVCGVPACHYPGRWPFGAAGRRAGAVSGGTIRHGSVLQRGLGMSGKRKTHTQRLLNNSKQLVRIQVKPPLGDFYLHEQQVGLRPGQTVVLPKDHLRPEQIHNLQARGVLKVVYDSETVEEMESVVSS